MATSKAPLRKLLLFLGLGTGFVLMAGWIWIQRAIDRTWAALGRQVEAFRRELEAEPSARPILRGEAIDGNAWDDYGPALAEYRRRAPAGLRRLVYLFLQEKPKVPPTAQDRVLLDLELDALGPAFDRLLQGARRAEAQPAVGGVNWSRRQAIDDDSFLSNAFSMAVVLEARRRESRVGVELLIAALQLGRDAAQSGGSLDCMAGIGSIRFICQELQTLAVEGRLDRGTLEELGPALDILDRSFPTTRWKRAEVLAYGQSILRGEVSIPESGDATKKDWKFGPGWRHAWSWRALQADAFFRGVDAVERLAGVDALPYGEARALDKGITAALYADRNPWVGELAMSLEGLAALFEYRARLRLLRMVVRFRETGTLAVLKDPLGDLLCVADAGSRIKIWSVGRDGVDDGGHPYKDVAVDLPR